MAIPRTEDITVLKGATFTRTLRWDTGVPVYKGISFIGQVAPAAIACTGHGVPDGWPVAIVSVQGMTQINVEDPADRSLYTPANVVDPNNLTLPFVNAASYSAYLTGGYVRYFAPTDLASFTARMHIRASINADDPATVELTSPTDIVLDNTAKTIIYTISAAVTAALEITEGVYDLELVNGDTVYRIIQGCVTIEDEVTR
jgi:hypothetical protein